MASSMEARSVSSSLAEHTGREESLREGHPPQARRARRGAVPRAPALAPEQLSQHDPSDPSDPSDHFATSSHGIAPWRERWAAWAAVPARSRRGHAPPTGMRPLCPWRPWQPPAAARVPPIATLPAAQPAWAGDWFRHALIYQVRVDSFADGRGHGHGDLQGVAQHLDHIARLSNCVWLSPVCRSPMRDGGYDVSDYTHVDPRFGTDAELDALIGQCHARGLRVIVELVANHAATEHPWFAQEGLYRKTYLQLQALNLSPAGGGALLGGAAARTPVERQAKALIEALGNGPHTQAATAAGYYTVPEQLERLRDLLYGSAQAQAASQQGDFFLWTQEPSQHFREAFLAFPDEYKSVWELDAASGSYYYHSFFAHQADLNYRSPRMRATMASIIRHWAQRGVDGLRIDAAPFFWKEEGTPCMNLPGMHALFRDWRTMLAQTFPHVALLAEAVQPPEQLSSYFGSNDECHMMFNAPLAEALFHALARESAMPLQRVVAGLSKIPAQAQLATFLRNHDEFYTAWLEPAEEQAVWERFAPNPEHRVHHGIRRRLASMVHDPQALRLLTGLLYLFPGSPTLYYGDEIGMGDRFTEVKPGPAEDRDAMRTPMQWTDGPTGGFTQGRPEVQPILTGPYATAQVNVAQQERAADSLLHWHRHLAALRQQMPLWALGSLEVRDSGNPHVLCFTRSYQGKQCLVVANLSGQPQSLCAPNLTCTPGGEAIAPLLHSPSEPASSRKALSIQRLVTGDRLTAELPPHGLQVYPLSTL